MAIQIYICILFCLQYLASVSSASPMALDSPAEFNDPQPSESTPAKSVDIDPDNVVQDQKIQVNLPKEGVDVGCQFHAKGKQVMMKSAETQAESQVSAPQALKLRRLTSKFKKKTHLSRKLLKQSSQRSPHKRTLLTLHQHQNVYRMIPMYQDQKTKRKKN